MTSKNSPISYSRSPGQPRFLALLVPLSLAPRGAAQTSGTGAIPELSPMPPADPLPMQGFS